MAAILTVIALMCLFLAIGGLVTSALIEEWYRTSWLDRVAGALFAAAFYTGALGMIVLLGIE